MPNPYKKLLVTCSLAPPNPKCYVCSPKPEVTCLVFRMAQNGYDIVLRYLQQANIKLNTNSATVVTLQEKVYMYVATIVHNCWGKSVFIFSIPLCRLFSVVDLTVMCRNGVYMYMYIHTSDTEESFWNAGTWCGHTGREGHHSHLQWRGRNWQWESRFRVFSRKFLGGRREGGDSSGKSQNLNLNVVLWGYNIMLVADLKVGRGSREGMFHPDRDVE